MKAFVLFAPDFLEWPLANCRALQAAEPGTRTSGLAAGPESLAARLTEPANPVVIRLDLLDVLERRWICTQARP